MNINELVAAMRKDFAEIEDILLAKNKDYANRDDALANFDTLAEMCRILKVDVTKRDGVFMFFKLHKLCRVSNLLDSGEAARNEPMTDSLLDDIVYTLIFKASKEKVGRKDE